jgi:hypothetical protein
MADECREVLLQRNFVRTQRNDRINLYLLKLIDESFYNKHQKDIQTEYTGWGWGKGDYDQFDSEGARFSRKSNFPILRISQNRGYILRGSRAQLKHG